MSIKKLATAITATGVLVAAGPVAGAAADTTPADQPTTSASAPLIFVPPHVGPICVTIGAIILGGQMTSPGVHTCTTGTSLPSFSMPSFSLPSFSLPSFSLPSFSLPSSPSPTS